MATPQWLLFNDACVEPARPDDVLQLYGWQKAPCILCYTQVTIPWMKRESEAQLPAACEAGPLHTESAAAAAAASSHKLL